MKTFHLFIKAHSGIPDFNVYIDAENIEIAIHDLTKKYQLSKEIIEENIIDVEDEDDSNDYSPNNPLGNTVEAYDIEIEKEINKNLEP